MAVVSLMIGVNDQIRSDGSPEPVFRSAVSALLSRAVALTVGAQPRRVVVLSIPDWTATPAGLQRSIQMDDGGDAAQRAERQIGRFNAVLKEVAAAAGTHFVQGVTRISREGLVRQELTGDDGLHPSAHQYAEWAAATLPAVRAALSDSDGL
jgi:lysophospholipase L1-like esterase